MTSKGIKKEINKTPGLSGKDKLRKTKMGKMYPSLRKTKDDPEPDTDDEDDS